MNLKQILTPIEIGKISEWEPFTFFKGDLLIKDVRNVKLWEIKSICAALNITPTEFLEKIEYVEKTDYLNPVFAENAISLIHVTDKN